MFFPLAARDDDKDNTWYNKPESLLKYD